MQEFRLIAEELRLTKTYGPEVVYRDEGGVVVRAEDFDGALREAEKLLVNLIQKARVAGWLSILPIVFFLIHTPSPRRGKGEKRG